MIEQQEELFLCDLYKLGENFRVVDGELGQNLTVYQNLVLQQTVHEAAVTKVFCAAGGVNAGNPERTHVSFAGFASHIAVLTGFVGSILCPLDDAAAEILVTFGGFEELLVSSA